MLTEQMCREASGRLSFAKMLVEVEDKGMLPEKLVLRIPDDDFSEPLEVILKVVYPWRPSWCPTCKRFGHNLAVCPKSIRSQVEKEVLGEKTQVSGGKEDEGEFRKVQRKGKEKAENPINNRRGEGSYGGRQQPGVGRNRSYQGWNGRQNHVSYLNSVRRFNGAGQGNNRASTSLVKQGNQFQSLEGLEEDEERPGEFERTVHLGLTKKKSEVQSTGDQKDITTMDGAKEKEKSIVASTVKGVSKKIFNYQEGITAEKKKNNRGSIENELTGKYVGEKNMGERVLTEEKELDGDLMVSDNGYVIRMEEEVCVDNTEDDVESDGGETARFLTADINMVQDEEQEPEYNSDSSRAREEFVLNS